MDLNVYIAVSSDQDDRLLTIPLDVFSPKGDILATGAASPNRPAALKVADDRFPSDRVFVVARLPNGTTRQVSVETKNNTGSVQFDLRSTHDWLQWVAPFQSLDHLRDDNDKERSFRRRIGRVWMTLWSLVDGRWQSKQLDVAYERFDPKGVRQIAIDVPHYPHLLQVGGDEVGWRLVALPPGQLVRVALTRSAKIGGDSVDITIAREQADNEVILTYLTNGAISEANTLAVTLDVAANLLKEKIADPVSAVAGGYFMLRNNTLAAREQWVQNLKNWFPAIADGAILSAALAARSANPTEARIRKDIKTALQRGLPIFKIGADMLLQTMAAIHRGEAEKKGFHQSYLALQAYVRASIPVGPYFAFEGMSPAEPTWISVFGPQDEPGFGEEEDGTPRGQLVYSRPRSVRGRYGQTTVQLPRAPVSASAEAAMARAIATQQTSLPAPEVPIVTVKPLSTRNNSRRLPLTETTFLSHLSLPASIPVLDINDRTYPRRRTGPSSSPQPRASPDPITVVGPSRQTERYWRQQRETNAFTMFDE